MKHFIIAVSLLGPLLALENDSLTGYRTASVQFTLDFFRKLYEQSSDQNSVLSPASIQTSLAMMYHVAGGKCREELQRTLGLPDDTVQAVHGVQQFLNKINNEALKVVSKVYHATQQLNPNLGPTLTQKYNVQLEPTNFQEPQKVAASANAWIKQATNGMLDNVLEASDITTDDNLMLLNAVFMNASWEQKFNSDFITQELFHFENGDQLVDMMSEDDDYNYGEVDDLRFVELLYKEQLDLSMLLIMPHEGSLKSIVNRMDSQMYRRMLQSLQEENVILKVPKFSINKNVEAKAILQRMGLNATFEPDAFDIFTELVSQLADIRQSAKIDVTEDGTVAAAVSVVRYVLHMGPARTIEFFVDKPFMFIIRKRSTNDIVFIGHFAHHD